MRVFDAISDLTDDARGAVAALGNFDGVHKGHQALIGAARREAEKLGAPLGVITFEPHPRRFFQADAPAFRLTPAAEKARILSDLGVELLYRLTFDETLSQLTAEAFISDVLNAQLGVRQIVVGEDFRFGRGRKGDATMLRSLGEAAGFGCSIHHLVGAAGTEFSSTASRVMIEQGLVADAAAILGRWHTVSGVVEKGDQRGRELGYPTANLKFGEQLTPRFGIYAAKVSVHSGQHVGEYDGVASIGERPTFGINAPNFEVHLFDFDGDLYGADVSVGLVAYLRGEKRFDSVADLISAMDADSARARDALASATILG